MSARPCGTCTKPVYPKEKTAISNIWVHKGCLKCSLCSSTLALNSTYVGLDADGEKRLFCKQDTPRMLFTSVVDSVALRQALTAPKADQLRSGGRLGGGKMGSMRFKGLTLRSKALAGGLNAPKVQGDGSRNKIVIGTVRGATLDSWDIASALDAQSKVSSPLSSFPALKAQLTGSSEASFLSPSILVPQHTGSTRAPSSDAGTESEPAEDKDEDGIAREKKGQKEAMPIGPGLVKHLLRAFQLEEVREVNLPANHVRAPTPFAFRGTPTDVPSPLGADDGTLDATRFMSVKPSTIAARPESDLVDVRTLGTRRETEPAKRKPALKSLFDPPSAAPAPDSPKKHVKISSQEPSLISVFAAGDVLPPLPDSPTDENDPADADAVDEAQARADDEELIRAMQGLEIVMVYEEEPEAEPEHVEDGRVHH